MSRKTKIRASRPASGDSSAAPAGLTAKLAAYGGICAALLILIALTYGQVLSHDFVSVMDPVLVNANPGVLGGLTLAGLKYAFTEVSTGVWQPLVWLSFQWDAQFYGTDPSAHHFTNVGLHGLSAVLVFALLSITTGWRSGALAAALVFAVHPVQTEAVAWISARAMVLGTFLMLASGVAMAWSNRNDSARWRWLGLGLLVAACMSSPTAAVLPVLLWLAGVAQWERMKALAGVAVSAVGVAVWAGRQIPADPSSPFPTLVTRLSNSVAAFAQALSKLAWPTGLSPSSEPAGAVWTWAGAAALVTLVVAAWVARKRLPAVSGGIVWFVVSLASALWLGPMQNQTYRDHSVYAAIAGAAVAVAWLARWVAPVTVREHAAGRAAGLVVVGLLAWKSYVQAGYWYNDEVLFRQEVTRKPESGAGYSGLGMALFRAQRYQEATDQFREAVRRAPKDANAHLSLAQGLYAMDRNEEALAEIEQAIRLAPNPANGLYNRGLILRSMEREQEAIQAFEAAQRAGLGAALQPRCFLQIGLALNKLKRYEEALGMFRRALELDSSLFLARKNLAWTYYYLQNWPEAEKVFEYLAKIDPNDRDIAEPLRFLRHRRGAGR